MKIHRWRDIKRRPPQPEPACFVAPLDLEGDPPASYLTHRAIVGAVFALVAFLVFVTCEGCASLPAKHWSPPTATVVITPNAPACAAWSVVEAWELLSPNLPMTIVSEAASAPVDGQILIDWRAPPDYPVTLATALPIGDTNITRATLRLNRCQARLFAHELGHALGLHNIDEPGALMHWLYPAGGYAISRRERRVLEAR